MAPSRASDASADHRPSLPRANSNCVCRARSSPAIRSKSLCRKSDAAPAMIAIGGSAGTIGQGPRPLPSPLTAGGSGFQNQSHKSHLRGLYAYSTILLSWGWSPPYNRLSG